MNPQPPVTRMRTPPSNSAGAGALADFLALRAADVLRLSQSPQRPRRMTENEIVLDAAFVVHTKLGPGVFESD